MKCEMACTKRAKLKISQSDGTSQCLCFRHGFLLIKYLIRRLGTYDFGIYIQQPPEPAPPRVIAPEARHAVTLPEDREGKKEVLSTVASTEDADWEWDA